MDQPRIGPTEERPAEQHTTEESLPLSQFEITFAISSVIDDCVQIKIRLFLIFGRDREG